MKYFMIFCCGFFCCYFFLGGGSFLTKTNVLLAILKMTWVDRHVPTINLLYCYFAIFNPIWVPKVISRPQKGLHIKLNGKLWSILTKTNCFLSRWICKHFLNHIWVTEALIGPQKRPNMVSFLNHIASIPYYHAIR